MKSSLHRILFTLITISFFLPLPILANDSINLAVGGDYANLTNLTPSMYVKTIINVLVGGAGVLAFIYLLLGGIQWIMAGGDKDAVEKSRKKITQALIGLVIVFSSYAILFVIRVLFQVDLIQFTITNLGA